MNETEKAATVANHELQLNMSISNPEVVAHFGSMELSGSELSSVVETYLWNYIRIVDTASKRAEELSLSKAVTSAENRMERKMEWVIEKISTLVEESVGREGHTVKALQSMEAGLEKYTTTEDSPLFHHFGLVVREVLRKTQEETGSSPEAIRAVVVGEVEPRIVRVEEAVKAIRDEYVTKKQVDEVVESTPRKGRPFEDLAHESIAVIAEAANDLCEATGDTEGLLGRNAGDTVVTHTVDGQPRFNVVFEAKNKASMSSNDWIKEAEAALPNRDALVFVGLSKQSSSVPGKSGFSHIRENVFVLHFDPDSEPGAHTSLRIVYRFAMAIARKLLAGENTSGVGAAVDKLNEMLSDVTSNYKIAKKMASDSQKIYLFLESLAGDLPQVLRLLEGGEEGL